MGFTYMWILAICGFLLRDQKSSASIFWIVITLSLVLPLILSVVFTFKFRREYRYAYLITGIPAVLGILLQYFLLSFIPNIVVPRGVMVHIMGTPQPFDILGQLVAALPIIGWAIIFPVFGCISVEIVSAIRSRLHPKQN